MGVENLTFVFIYLGTTTLGVAVRLPPSSPPLFVVEWVVRWVESFQAKEPTHVFVTVRY